MKASPNESIHIIQLTDTHLFSTDSKKLQGYATNQLFSDSIEEIKPESKDADFIFLTGDISEDRSAESYRYAAAYLSQFHAPVYWIVGNHDHAPTAQSVFGEYKNLRQLTHLSTPYWDFIALNSCREGTNDGHIEPEEMARFLAQLAISKKNKKHVAVVMHHHPVAVGTPLLDECMLQDNEVFLRAVREHSEVKLIMCGHVHGDYKVELDGSQLEVCPAISFQWKKGTSALETDDTRAFKRFVFEQNSYLSSVVYL